MLTVNRLCCLRLHTAGVVVGWIGGGLSLLKLIVYAVLIARIEDLVKAIIDNEPNNKMNENSIRISLLVVLSLYLFSNVIHFMASLLLVAGTMKERHLMIVPWLINDGLYLLFSLIAFIIMLIVFIGGHVPFGTVFGYVLFSGIYLAIQYLIFTAIYSLYKLIQLSAQAEQQRLISNKAGQNIPSYTRI